MFYIKKDQENEEALDHIKTCLKGFNQMKFEKESELLDAYEDYQKGIANLDKTLELEDEIKKLENYVNAIAYTYDYVNLMIKMRKKS